MDLKVFRGDFDIAVVAEIPLDGGEYGLAAGDVENRGDVARCHHVADVGIGRDCGVKAELTETEHALGAERQGGLEGPAGLTEGGLRRGESDGLGDPDGCG